MERRSNHSGIGFRLSFFLVALCVLIGGMGVFTIWRFQSVIAPLEREMPDVLRELDRTQRLGEIASTPLLRRTALSQREQLRFHGRGVLEAALSRF